MFSFPITRYFPWQRLAAAGLTAQDGGQRSVDRPADCFILKMPFSDVLVEQGDVAVDASVIQRLNLAPMAGFRSLELDRPAIGQRGKPGRALRFANHLKIGEILQVFAPVGQDQAAVEARTDVLVLKSMNPTAAFMYG